MNFSKYYNKKIECLKAVRGIKLGIFDPLVSYKSTSVLILELEMEQ